jgi:protein O-GlcNAc transferase
MTTGLVAVGCDVLWGGCPMVTLPLERMASRVAASLCYATGLGQEMVFHSQLSPPPPPP